MGGDAAVIIVARGSSTGAPGGARWVGGPASSSSSAAPAATSQDTSALAVAFHPASYVPPAAGGRPLSTFCFFYYRRLLYQKAPTAAYDGCVPRTAPDAMPTLVRPAPAVTAQWRPPPPALASSRQATTRQATRSPAAEPGWFASSAALNAMPVHPSKERSRIHAALTLWPSSALRTRTTSRHLSRAMVPPVLSTSSASSRGLGRASRSGATSPASCRCGTDSCTPANKSFETERIVPHLSGALGVQADV